MLTSFHIIDILTPASTKGVCVDLFIYLVTLIRLILRSLMLK